MIGTLFAMVTAADPRWWEANFSQLGVGWAFNGTLVVAGLLVATVGSYIGRDLHRLLGESMRQVERQVFNFASGSTTDGAVFMYIPPLGRAAYLGRIWFEGA